MKAEMFGKKIRLLIMLFVILFAALACGQTPAGEEPETTADTQMPAEVREAIDATLQILPEPTETLPPQELTELPTEPAPAIEGCKAKTEDTAEALAVALQEALLARDIAVLQESFMNNPMAIGYWLGEGVIRSPAEMASELNVSLLPGDTSGLTFMTNREDFPPLGGIAPETMFGPGVEVSTVIYSEGWGADGQGGALLFIARDGCGAYYWHGLAISHVHFDK
ncbi:MAG: hypothetical protein MUO76_17790 [Anaerolineaceae bacterium]|nr:hypothetical protein [Anaerolineaceae bacterium]